MIEEISIISLLFLSWIFIILSLIFFRYNSLSGIITSGICAILTTIIYGYFVLKSDGSKLNTGGIYDL